MAYPENVASAAAVESRPFLEKQDAQAAENDRVDLEQWSSKSACSSSGKHVFVPERSFLRGIGPLNAIVLICNLVIATSIVITWALRRPAICSCNDGQWCKFVREHQA